MNSKKALKNIVINFDNMGMICSNLNYEEFYIKDLYFKEVFKTEYENILKNLDRLEKLEKVIDKIKNILNCDVCNDNWNKGCMCFQKKLKELLLIDNFENMFRNCKLIPLPELEELQDDK